MIPVMDGVKLIRTLRQLNPDLRFISSSGAAGPAQIAELDQLMAQRMLSKPLHLETLLQAVGQVLLKN